MRNFILGMAISVAAAIAAPIAVNNASFETFNPLNLDCSQLGAGCQFNQSQIPSWTMTGLGGSFQPGNPANTNFFNFIPDGSVIAYLDSGQLVQTVGATIQLGLTYTLEVEVGDRIDSCCAQTGTIALIIGNTVIAGVGGAAGAGGWTTHTVQYVAQAGDVGSSIAIRLQGSGAQGNFDNVRLSDSGVPTSSDVPEPGSAAMLLLGLAGLAHYRRKV